MEGFENDWVKLVATELFLIRQKNVVKERYERDELEKTRNDPLSQGHSWKHVYEHLTAIIWLVLRINFFSKKWSDHFMIKRISNHFLEEEIAHNDVHKRSSKYCLNLCSMVQTFRWKPWLYQNYSCIEKSCQLKWSMLASSTGPRWEGYVVSLIDAQ